MSTVLLPQIHTLTERSRVAFLTMVYSKGWTWMGLSRELALSEAIVERGDRRKYFIVSGDQSCIHWNPSQMGSRYTLVNSIPHFVDYVARNKIPLVVNELRARP